MGQPCNFRAQTRSRGRGARLGDAGGQAEGEGRHEREDHRDRERHVELQPDAVRLDLGGVDEHDEEPARAIRAPQKNIIWAPDSFP